MYSDKKWPVKLAKLAGLFMVVTGGNNPLTPLVDSWKLGRSIKHEGKESDPKLAMHAVMEIYPKKSGADPSYNFSINILQHFWLFLIHGPKFIIPPGKHTKSS
jgi:hypothetical protein